MKSFTTVRTIAIAGTAAALLGLAYGIAHAITSAEFKYNKARVGYFSIGAAAFAPEGTSPNYTTHGGDFISTSGNDCFVTGVNVPQGATLTDFTAWVASNVNDGVSLVLTRRNLATGDKVFLAELDSFDTSSARVALNWSIDATPAAIVNNQHFSYSVSLCLAPATSNFYSARITYRYSDAGD